MRVYFHIIYGKIFLRFFLYIFLCIFGLVFFQTSFGFFEIAEVMPNTIDDSQLEYVTIKNLKTTPLSLSGFVLQDAQGKIYTFTGVILEAHERKQFFRPQTRITLNNTDETLTLFSATGAKIDEIYYTTSTKGVFLSFEDIIPDETEEGVISDETYISGEVYISDEVVLPPEEDSEETQEETPTLTSPEILFHLQRPSYITQSGSSDIYICDPKQAECKVNFDLTGSFNSHFLEKYYRCEGDFGLGFLTGEEQKCNPNTVVFPGGTTRIHFKIFHKNNAQVFSERYITIIFQKQESTQISQGAIGGVGTENLMESPRIHILDPIIEIQSGVTGLGTNFFCEKALCKVNLKYKKIHTLERCYWNFGPGEQTSENTHKSCNPGIVTFGPGVHELSLRVYESSRESNEKIVRFFVHNIAFPEMQESEKLVSDISDESNKNTISIHLQGKISKEKVLGEKNLTCHNIDRCFVNFEAIFYKNPEKGSTIGYVWKKNGEIFSQKQNPSGIWLERGKYEIILELYEDEKVSLFDVWNIEVLGKEQILKKQEEKFQREEQKNMSFSGRIYEGLILGKILPNPVGNDAKEFIEIRNTSGYTRMLGGCILQDASKKFQFPDEPLKSGMSRYFFNTETKISLGNSKDTIVFSCNSEVLGTQDYERKMQENEFLSGDFFQGFRFVEIQDYVPKNIQQEYISKSISLQFTVLKREGLKISGTTFPNTKIELIHGGKTYLTLRADAQGAFLLKTKDFSAGEYVFDVRLTQEDIFFELYDFKKLSLSPSQRASWFQKSAKKKKTPILKIPKLLVTGEEYQEIGMKEKSLSFQEQIFFIFLLCIVAAMVSGHIFFLSFPKKLLYTFALPIEIMRFQTRQKLVLLGV